MKKGLSLIMGILIILFLIIAYFIKFTVEEGANYSVQSSLLGIVIFHNPFILAIYILIAIVLIFRKEK